VSVLVGKLAKVMVGASKVAEIGSYSLSGFSREALEASEFGDDIKDYVAGLGDGGEISFSGNYDITDTNGQMLLESALKNASIFTGGDMKFYVDNTKYFTVKSGGNILITKVKAVSFEKAGIGTIEFTGKISGGYMKLW